MFTKTHLFPAIPLRMTLNAYLGYNGTREQSGHSLH